MECLTVKEVAEKRGISGRRVNLLCNEGRIEAQRKKVLCGLYQRMLKNLPI